MNSMNKYLLEKLYKIASAGTSALELKARESIKIYKKTDSSLLTNFDISANDAIVEVAKKEFQKIPIFTEESWNASWYNNEICLIIDPLDGTTNFVHELPFSSVSIAIVEQGSPTVGVIVPLEGGWYFSIKGYGSYYNSASGRFEKSISLKCAKYPLSDAIINITCDQSNSNSRDIWWKWIKALKPPTSYRLRIIESAAIEMCWLASGKIDGYLHPTDEPWNVAAGALIASEAGVRLWGPDFGQWRLDNMGIIALTPNISDDVKRVLRTVDQ